MTTATMTFPPRQVLRIQLRTLRWPGVVLVVTVIIASWLKSRECFGVGGATITGIGSYLWAVRTFRLRDPDASPPSLTRAPRGPREAVPLLGEGFRELQLRSIDTLVSRMGVWIAIFGGLFGTVVPFILGLAHVWTGMQQRSGSELAMISMSSVDWLALFGAFRDLALGGAAVVTAWAAVRGLQKWREELRGKTDFEVARGLARATYNVRDQLASCRTPLIRSAEYPSDYKWPAPGQSENPAAKANALAHVYNNRWKLVTDAVREFDAWGLEAEALWGADIRADAEALRKCATTVFASIESIIDDAKAGGAHFEADKEFGRRMRSQAHASRTATDNLLSNEITAAVLAIESRLSVHLQRAK